MKKNRRQFLRHSSLALGAPALLSLPFSEYLYPGDSAPEGTTILFQGDSITDAGRDRGAYYANNSSGLGKGYSFLAAGSMLATQPGKGLRIYNRGISGNKVFQLANRWQDDCLNLQPNVLSILIGVNDIWHKLNGRYDGTPAIYERDYRALLQRTREVLPDVKLIVCEPFAVEGGSAINDSWFPEFDAYRAAAKKISMEFEAQFIPYHSLFAEWLKEAPASYWCPDGVHPSLAGAQMMAMAWLEAFRKIKW